MPSYARDDDLLLSELADAVAETRSLPGDSVLDERMADAARAAYTWRTIDEELALLALTYDSSVDEGLLVRGGVADLARPRTVVFASDRTEVEVELTGVRVIGRVEPPAPGAVITVDTPAGALADAVVDDLGYFACEAAVSGVFRITVTSATGAFSTPWLTR